MEVGYAVYELDGPFRHRSERATVTRVLLRPFRMVAILVKAGLHGPAVQRLSLVIAGGFLQAPGVFE